MDDDTLMTPSEIVAYLRISHTTLERYLNAGMPCLRLPGRRRFIKADVLQWIQERNTK